MKKRRSIQKILLVNPSISIYPEYDDLRIAQSFGLACICGALKKYGDYEIEFLDVAAEGAVNRQFIDDGLLKVGLSDEDVADNIAKSKPDVVAVSNLHTAQFLNAVKICAISKKVSNEIITVIGGTHASLNFREALITGYIDFVVIGEGERKFSQLIRALSGKDKLSNCEAIAFVQDKKIKLIIPNNNRSSDNLPDPDFSIFKKNLYCNDVFYAGIIRGNYAVPYVSSRGCPQRCVFCCSNAIWGNKFRSYSIETIQRHLNIIKNLGYDEILFEDDNLLVNPILANKIFTLLKEKGFIWSLTGGLDRSRLTNEIVDLLIETKCARVNIGIESENLSLLRRYHKYKGIDDSCLELCEKVRKLTEGGVETFGDFMIGFPDQRLQDIRNTIDFGKRLRENGLGLALFHIVTPFPGTKFFCDCKEKGYIREPLKWENFTFAKGNLSTTNFTSKQMTNMRIQAFIEVNGQEMWEEARKKLQRPNLQTFYLTHRENKWSKFFNNKKA